MHHHANSSPPSPQPSRPNSGEPGDHGAVGLGVVDPPQGELPADLGLQLAVVGARAHPRTWWSAQPGPLFQPGRLRKMQASSTRRVRQSALPSCLPTFAAIRPASSRSSRTARGRRVPTSRAARRAHDPGDRRSAHRTSNSPARGLGRPIGVDALASRTEDAVPRREQERHVDLPDAAVFPRVVEGDPLPRRTLCHPGSVASDPTPTSPRHTASAATRDQERSERPDADQPSSHSERSDQRSGA